MNKFIALYVAIFMAFSCNAQQIRLRPSLGNGKAYSTDHQIYRSPNSADIITFDKNYRGGFRNRVLNLPQAGLMLEFTINNSHTLGFGIMAGRTELNFSNTGPDGIMKSSDGISSTIKKIGFEYGYKKDFGRLYITPLAGLFLIDHKYNNYGCCAFTFIRQDVNGYTTDSSTTNEIRLNDYGYMASVGLRIGLLNKQQKERLSLTFLYDHGFTPLWQSTSYTYFNYLTEYTNASSVARGSQFKIYLSMPINIYNTSTKKFSWQKAKDKDYE